MPGSFDLQYNGILPYDNARGFVTSIALLNPGSFSTVSVPITIYDENGAVLKTETLTLQAGGRSHLKPARAGRKQQGSAARSSFKELLALGLHSAAASIRAERLRPSM